MSIYDLFNKKTWFMFSILYIFILCKYFFINNIPLQFDSNIFILFVICLILFIFIMVILYFFIGSIERFFMLKEYDENKKDIIFKNFDFHVIFVLMPINVLIYLFKNNTDEVNSSFIYIFFVVFIYCFCLLISAIRNKKWLLYINSIIFTILFFYQALINFNNLLLSFLFLFYLTIAIFLFVKDENNKINNKFGFNIDDLYLYNFLNNKVFIYKKSIINTLKIDLYSLFIIIIISFFMWNILITQNKTIDFISQNIFKITKIGSFKCKLILENNKFKDQFNEKIEENANTFSIEAEVIWTNNSDMFIKYKNTSIKIKQDQILAIKYLHN